MGVWPDLAWHTSTPNTRRRTDGCFVAECFFANSQRRTREPDLTTEHATSIFGRGARLAEYPLRPDRVLDSSPPPANSSKVFRARNILYPVLIRSDSHATSAALHAVVPTAFFGYFTACCESSIPLHSRAQPNLPTPFPPACWSLFSLPPIAPAPPSLSHQA